MGLARRRRPGVGVTIAVTLQHGCQRDRRQAAVKKRSTRGKWISSEHRGEEFVARKRKQGGTGIGPGSAEGHKIIMVQQRPNQVGTSERFRRLGQLTPLGPGRLACRDLLVVGGKAEQ